MPVDHVDVDVVVVRRAMGSGRWLVGGRVLSYDIYI